MGASLLTGMSYSREHEAKADCFAVALMRQAHLPTAPMADLLVAIGDAPQPEGADRAADEADKPAKPANGWITLLSSHPDTAQRAARLRQGRAGRCGTAWPASSRRRCARRCYPDPPERQRVRPCCGPPASAHDAERSVETELKLLIDPADVAAFRRHPAIRRCALGPPRSQRLISTYFDTPDRRLRQQGLVWRVRRAGRNRVQTVKADGEVLSGLHRRPEWESPVASLQPDFAALAAVAAAAAPGTDLPPGLAALEQELVPIFAADFRRTVWRLRLPGDAEVELALDQGVLRAGERERPLHEIELEIAAGDAAALFDFALELADGVPLRLGHQSKAERGFALHAANPQPAIKSRPAALAPTVTVAGAFRAVVGSCLAQMQANEVGVIEGGDADCLHQMRVGMRRLRTALRLFRRQIALPLPLQQGLQRLAAELGAARDAEVLADHTLAHVLAGSPHDAALQRLRKAAAAAAAARHRAAAAALVRPDHARLMLGLGAWLHGPRWRESLDHDSAATLDAPIEDSAARILARCRKRLVAADPGPAPAAPEQRHAVRIAAKRLRYAIEFFAGLYPPSRARRVLARLARLQDTLGWLNDVAVADAALRQLAQRRPGLADAAAFARGFLHADARKAEGEWPALLDKCLSARMPWR